MGARWNSALSLLWDNVLQGTKCAGAFPPLLCTSLSTAHLALTPTQRTLALRGKHVAEVKKRKRWRGCFRGAERSEQYQLTMGSLSLQTQNKQLSPWESHDSNGEKKYIFFPFSTPQPQPAGSDSFLKVGSDPEGANAKKVIFTCMLAHYLETWGNSQWSSRNMPSALTLSSHHPWYEDDIDEACESL